MFLNLPERHIPSRVKSENSRVLDTDFILLHPSQPELISIPNWLFGFEINF